MQTVTITETSLRSPYLEFTAPGERTRRLEINEFPFTIGRNESCCLAVPSNRVSRDHAVLRREGGGYFLKDLGSTNGTFVNGERITEIRLRDGDLILFGDAEYCFRSGDGETARRTVTQLLDHVPPREKDEANEEARQVIQVLRARQEALLHRAVRLRFLPIVDLKTHKPVAFEVVCRPPAHEVTGWETQLDSLECRLTDRRLELTRLLAVEQAHGLPNGTDLMLTLETAEVGADGLPDLLSRWQELAGKSHRLVAAIPDSAVADIPYFRTFVGVLRQRGIGVSYYDFAAGSQQLRSRKDFAGDYLQLAAALTRGIDRSSERQRQLKELFATAKEIGTKVIATGLHSEHEAACCMEVGCQLASGDLFGMAGTIDPTGD